MSLVLRDYQQQAIEAVNRSFERGYKAPLVSIFTGGGKTEIFIALVSQNINLRKQRGLIMAPAHLILQTKDRFARRAPQLKEPTRVDGFRMMPTLGVLMGDFNEPEARVVVGSVPTLIDKAPVETESIVRSDFIVNEYGGVELSPESSRTYLISNRADEVLKYGLLDYVIYDEAHHAVADGSLLFLTRLKEIYATLKREPVKVVGFTATPKREDDRGLHNVFDTICFQRSFEWGIRNEYLAPLQPPIRVLADLGNRREKVLRTTDWADSVVKAWVERAEGRPTLAYMQDVDSSRELAAAFRAAGHPFAHVDAEEVVDQHGNVYGKDHREILFQSFMRGEVQGICNYSVFLEGTDLPPASCMVWARNTENIVLTTQAVGRVLRLFPGNEYLPKKTDAIILDVTSSDLEVMTAGTLAGFTYDPTTKEYVEDTDEEETEEVVEGLDIRDSMKGNFTDAKGVVYSVGRLIRRSGSDWYHDENTDVLSLGVSDNDALVIIPPHYTLATHLQMVAHRLMAERTQDPADLRLSMEYDKVATAEEFFGCFTLWHVKDKLVPMSWVRAQRDSLDLLMDFAVPYVQEVADPVSAFMNRNQRWKRQPMTDGQRRMLTGMMGHGKFEAALTCGEASQLITHTIAFNKCVSRRIAAMYKELGSYTTIPTMQEAI